jgi:DNA-binding response OmpR family regulator
MKILIVDDDPDILDAVKMVLEMENYHTESISRGEEALYKAQTYNPDLILLDVLLSGTDGRKICRELKEDTSTKHIPIIMVSAHPNAHLSVAECRADSFIAKPFSVDHLLQVIKRYEA